MATIVKHAPTTKRYVLVGAGFGVFESSKPNWFLGNLKHDKSEGEHHMVCVSDPSGRLFWVDSDEIVVESIDGISPAEILDASD